MDTVVQDAFKIKTAVFEGPFELLLDLVEKRKLFINDVSLATVTEEYLGHIKRIGDINPSKVAVFLVVASTLLLIKSRSLLPNINLTDEEEGDIKNLEERLRLYQIFTRLGGKIKGQFGRSMIFAAQERRQDILVFLPDNQISKESMMAFAKVVIGDMPKKEILPEVPMKKVMSIEEAITSLTERIKSAMKMSFKDLGGKIATKEEKVTVIVSFLAMLELVRQGIIHAVQDEGYADIMLHARENNQDE